MNSYLIYEGNMERLMKKIIRIQNKCKKYGCEFHFEEVGEEYKEFKNESTGETFTRRFVKVEAEGVAVVGGWKFIATLEHTKNGNIIRRACDVEVPERYYNAMPICEHCNSNRYRKETYIVMNINTGEFKQVGKSCLRDFTHGMDAELVASWTALFDELIVGEAPCEGCNITNYYEPLEFLQYCAETIRHFGYVKGGLNTRSTAERASDYMVLEHGGFGWTNPEYRRKLYNEMESVGFNHNREESKKLAEDILRWSITLEENSNYMHNLKTVCSLNYITMKHFGLLASAFPTYDRELERIAQRKAIEEKNKEESERSEWVGCIGKRVEISVEDFKVLTGWETQWGYVSVYKFVDKDGNVFTWKTSGYLPEKITKLKGTVKEHKEYRGVKQTELSRCKIN